MTIVMLSVSSMIFDSRIQKEALSLRDEGHDVTIIYVEDQKFFYGLPNPEEVWQNYLLSMNGIKNVRHFLTSRQWSFLPSFVNKSLQGLELFFRFLVSVFKNRADVYHIHDLTPALFGIIGKFIFGSKLIYDAHELEVVSSGGGPLKKTIKSLYEKATMKFADSAITVNNYISEIMTTKYKKHVEVIANLPSFLSNKELEPHFLKNQVNEAHQKNIILYVGNVNHSRGIDKVAIAMKYLPDDYIFLIMGTGRLLEFQEFLKSLLLEHVIPSKKVKFIGPYSPDMVVPYLAGATVSVMMYQANTDNSVLNAPNKFYQSIMARVPVLASNNKSFPVLIYDNICGKVGEVADEKDPKSIAHGISKIVNDPNYLEFKQNANCLAKQSSWEEEAKTLLKIYDFPN